MAFSRDGLESAFDKRAATYDSNVWHVRYAERLVELAAPAPAMRILDAVTGTGLAAIAAARLAGPTAYVLGVDVSAGMLNRARRSIASRGLPNVDLIKADAAALPQLESASFDLILCSAGLLYLPVRTALREWRRLLRPGGLVGFSTMHEGFPVTARLFREHAAHYGLTLTDPAAPLGTPSSCRRELHDAGFLPANPVVEAIRFSRDDLAYAWQAHAQGPHHDALAVLEPDRVAAFRAEYTTHVADLLAADEDQVLTSTVIYAFGRAAA